MSENEIISKENYEDEGQYEDDMNEQQYTHDHEGTMTKFT